MLKGKKSFQWKKWTSPYLRLTDFMSPLLSQMHTQVSTHTTRPVWGRGGSGCLQTIFEGEPVWFLKWTQQEIFSSPSAPDQVSGARSFPLPDWDQWPVTKGKRCLQHPQWEMAGLTLWWAPSGPRSDLERPSSRPLTGAGQGGMGLLSGLWGSLFPHHMPFPSRGAPSSPWRALCHQATYHTVSCAVIPGLTVLGSQFSHELWHSMEKRTLIWGSYIKLD